MARIAVIGAGLGGLSAAIRLRVLGHDVTVFEKNDVTGGKVRKVEHGEFYFDCGPSLITMPHVIEELFAFAGRDVRDFLEIVPLKTVCRYRWTDGTMLDAATDIEIMQERLAALNETDARHYQDFAAYSRKIYERTHRVFLESAIHEPAEIMDRENLGTLFHILDIDPFRTMYAGIRKYFSDPRIVQLFSRFATYNGSSPYKAPATLNIIQHVEHGMGGNYIMGGVYSLVQALTNLADSLGIEIRTSAEVASIVQQSKQATGVMVNGEYFRSDFVVCNQDVVTASAGLLDESERKLQQMEPSLSGLVFLWGMNDKFPSLSHHNVFFSENYHTEFTQLFDEGRPADDPTIYIAVPGKTDPSIDTGEKESWFVLINMPFLRDTSDWGDYIKRTKKAVIERLAKHGIEVDGRIEYEQTITPQDFASRYHANAGSIYGLSSNSPMSAFRRPANRSRSVKGLYYVGGSTHPGGGVPLVMLSGKITAELLQKEAVKDNQYTTSQ